MRRRSRHCQDASANAIGWSAWRGTVAEMVGRLVEPG